MEDRLRDSVALRSSNGVTKSKQQRATAVCASQRDRNEPGHFSYAEYSAGRTALQNTVTPFPFLGKISVPFANKTFSRRRTFKPFFARYPIRTISSPGFSVFPFQPAILDTRFGLLSSPCHFSIERSSFVMSMKISIWGFRK